MTCFPNLPSNKGQRVGSRTRISGAQVEGSPADPEEELKNFKFECKRIGLGQLEDL